MGANISQGRLSVEWNASWILIVKSMIITTKMFFANILNGKWKHGQIIGNFPFFIEKTHCTCKLKLLSPLQDYNIFGTCTQCA